MFVQSFAKGPVTQRKRMNYARITHILSFLRGVLNGSKNFRCVIYESAGVVYVSSMRDYARDTRRPSVLMRRNWFETAHVHFRSLTPHLHITHEPCTYHVYRETNVLVRGTYAKPACLDSLRQWFVRLTCVECSWNNAPYLLVCVDVRHISVIRQWLEMIPPPLMRDSCVISQWFLPPTPRNFGQFLDAKARTNPICASFVSDSCVIGSVTGPLFFIGERSMIF